jgi:TP901 family phage tail tape measure protein
MAASAEKHLKLVISAYTKGAETGLKNIQGEFSRLRSDVPGVAKALEAASRALDVRTMRSVNHEVAELRKQYALLRDKGVLSQKELAQAATNLKTRTAQLRAEYDQIGRAQKQQIASTSNLTLHIKRLAGAYLGLRAWQDYSAFAQRLSEVHTMTELSAEGLRGLGDEISDLSLKIPQSAASLAAAEYDILSAGVALGDSTRVLEQAAQAAVAGVTDTKTAAQTGLGVINAYGLNIGELGTVYDALFQTVKSGVTTFPELAQSLGDTLPTAKAAGVDYREVGAAIAAMTKAGIQTPKATTALKGAINALAAPTAESKKQFAALGITWRGLIPTLEQIAQKNLSLDQMRMLIPDVEARTGVLALTQNLTGLRQVMADMGNAGGSMQDAYAKMKDTPANQTQAFSNALSALNRELMDVASVGLLPVLRGLTWLVSENKHLVAGLIGAGGAVYALSLANKAMLTIGTTIDLLRKKKLAGLAVDAAGGLTQMAGAATMAKMALKGLLVYEAALAPGRVIELVQTIREWREAAGEADAAHRRLMAGVGETLQEFDKYKDFRLPGLNGKTVEDLQTIRKEIAHTHNYWTNMVIDLQDRANQTNWFGGLTEDAKVATVRLADAKRRLQQVKDELNQVNGALRTTGATAGQSLMTMEQALEKVQLAVLRYHEKQDLLTAAMTRARDEQALLKADVQKLAEAYYQAAVALKTTQEGTGEHAKALAAKLQAEADYVAAVQQLHQHQMQEQAEQYADEEKELQQRLEKKLLDLEQSLELEWITEVEYAHRKAQAEEELARAVLEMRRATMQQSAKIYGEDSHEYRQARAAMVDAELALQRASMATRHRWEEMIGIAKTSEHASKKLADSLAEVGRAGKKGGDEAAGGLAKVGKAADSAKSKVDSLNRSLDKQSDDGEGQTGRPSGGSGDGQSMAQYFHDQWNATTEMIQGMDTFEKLAQYEKQYRREIYDMSGRGSWMSSALRKHARDMVRKQRDALRLQSRNQLAAATAALRQRELQAAGPLAPAPQGAARKVTVEFKAPNGQSVSGQFGQGDADRLLDVLRQSGAVTSGG